MDRMIYTAMSGMNSALIRQRMTASNMANAQTIGFRAEVMQYTPITIDGEQLDVRAMSRTEVKGAMMTEGAMMRTGRDLDVACNGDVMLTVQAADGGEGYTRRGDLSISRTGVLQNGDGLPLIGENGPVTVPLGAEVTVAPDGAVLVRDPDTPDLPPQQIDKLKLANWRGSKMEKDLTNLFRVPNGGVLPVDENGRLTPATLEQSNVDPTQVLVEMVEAQRMFDLRTKLVATAKEIDEGGAGLMRMQG